MKNKYIFLGDLDSINSELLLKSFKYLKNKVEYIVVGDISHFKKDLKKITNLKILNQIYDPFNFNNINKNLINFYNVAPGQNKIDNMLAQLSICNDLCNLTGNDLITLPINKYTFKKKIKFNGMTEYLGILNKSETIMLMKGNKFSVIPITTHINLRKVGNNFNYKIDKFLELFKKIYKNSKELQFYKSLIFICFNPHCGENGTIGAEDEIIYKKMKSFKKLNFRLMPGDSAFRNLKKKSLYISFYHDQGLIPFKILNKISFNQTLGLNYRRLTPSHGTAKDIKFRNIADNSSFIKCMLD